MVKLFILPMIPDRPGLVFLNSEHVDQNQLFSDVKDLFTGKVFFKQVEGPEEADFLLLPHDYFVARKVPEYVATCQEYAKKTGKKTIIFAHGDGAENVPFSNSIIVRTSLYRDRARGNEIIMPPYTEDLKKKYKVQLSPRDLDTKPVVSFCGWAEYKNPARRLKMLLAGVINILLEAVTGNSFPARTRGLWWRKKAMSILKNKPSIETKFIIRSFYSAHRHTARVSKEILREEYVLSIINSDFVLAPRGDGNYSVRFYEALALGRLPILIDTESVLPLEGLIPYERVVVRVPYAAISRMPDFILNFWRSLSPEEYRARQREARVIFEKFLRMDGFLARLFESPERLESMVR